MWKNQNIGLWGKAAICKYFPRVNEPAGGKVHSVPYRNMNTESASEQYVNMSVHCTDILLVYLIIFLKCRPPRVVHVPNLKRGFQISSNRFLLYAFSGSDDTLQQHFTFKFQKPHVLRRGVTRYVGHVTIMAAEITKINHFHTSRCISVFTKLTNKTTKITFSCSHIQHQCFIFLLLYFFYWLISRKCR